MERHAIATFKEAVPEDQLKRLTPGLSNDERPICTKQVSIAAETTARCPGKRLVRSRGSRNLRPSTTRRMKAAIRKLKM